MPLIMNNPDLTPMYGRIWTDIARMHGLGGSPTFKESRIRILDSRFALYSDEGYFWFHICHPRKLYKRSMKVLGGKEHQRLIYDINWNTHVNQLAHGVCRACKYELTTQEQTLIRLAVIGIKR